MSDPAQTQTVLVTGGSGFIATHCLLQLHQAGYGLRATLRDKGRGSAIDSVLAHAHGSPVPVEWFEADLESDAGWHEATSGSAFVLHVASPIPRSVPKHDEELIRPARDGALRVLRAAADAGVQRVVMTSSTAAVFYGYGSTGRPFTEKDWSNPASSDNSAYTRSKTYAELAAWEFMETHKDLELTTINPGAVLGPVLERDYGTSAEIVLKLLNGDLPGLPRLGFPLVDVRDVANAHLCAMTHPNAAGERFLCANEFTWMQDIADVLREHLPDRANKIPRRRLPNWLMRMSALFDPVIRSVTFELGVKRDVDSSKLRDVLGVELRSNRDAITATADSLIAQEVV